jgi:Domain of unknown function (DUF397)
VDVSGAAWRKSSYSGGNGGQCVEVAAVTGNGTGPAGAGICVIRDSKDPDGPVLEFGHDQWRRFAAGVRARKSGPA